MKKVLLLLLFIVMEFCSCTYNSYEPTLYYPKVKAIISNNCMRCHSESGPWYGRPVAFDTDAEIVSMGSVIKDAVVVKVMPKGGSLSQAQIDTIVMWVNAGGQDSN